VRRRSGRSGDGPQRIIKSIVEIIHRNMPLHGVRCATLERVSLAESSLVATGNAVASQVAMTSLVCCTPQLLRRSLHAKHPCHHSMNVSSLYEKEQLCQLSYMVIHPQCRTTIS